MQPTPHPTPLTAEALRRLQFDAARRVIEWHARRQAAPANPPSR